MKKMIQDFYRKAEGFNRYLMSNKKRVKEIKAIYSANKKYFGKKVLDVACGGGILGFLIENYGKRYTGIDINPDMITNAKEYAKSIGSKNKFIIGDARKKRLAGRFDTITCLGNALCHFNTMDLIDIFKNINQNTHKGSFFIVDYRDIVKLLFDCKWKKRLLEKHKGRNSLNITRTCDTEKGELVIDSYSKRSHARFTHAILSPFVIGPMMDYLGWKLLKRKELKQWNGWIDVYKRL